ncbi:MAG: hypothetical protein ACP5HT_05230 [Conexivisphaera sp.]
MSVAMPMSTVGLRFRTYADYEAARALRAGHSLCPWSFALHRSLWSGRWRWGNEPGSSEALAEE